MVWTAASIVTVIPAATRRGGRDRADRDDFASLQQLSACLLDESLHRRGGGERDRIDLAVAQLLEHRLDRGGRPHVVDGNVVDLRPTIAQPIAERGAALGGARQQDPATSNRAAEQRVEQRR